MACCEVKGGRAYGKSEETRSSDTAIAADGS